MWDRLVWRAVVVMLLLVLAGGSPQVTVAGGADTSAADAAKERRLDQLIDNLVSEHLSVREASIEELNGWDHRAYERLQEVAKDETRPDVAAAAKRLVDVMQAYNLLICDAFGRALPGGTTVTITKQNGEAITLRTNPLGGIYYEGADRRARQYPYVDIRVEHPAYGIAEKQAAPREWQIRRIRFSLVPDDHELVGQSATGVVVDEAGRPIPNIELKTNTVYHSRNDRRVTAYVEALTDADGAFRFRPVIREQSAWGGRHGLDFDLHPEPPPKFPEQYYGDVTITPPAGSGYWPARLRVGNTGPTRITLKRPNLERSCMIEGLGGGSVDRAAEAKNMRLFFRHPDAQESVEIDPAVLFGRTKLLTGSYALTYNKIRYPQVTVTAESPDTIVFPLPPQITFTGQVIDAKTGKPVAGAVVFGWYGTKGKDNPLPLLTGEQWAALREMPADAPLDDEALAPLAAYFSIIQVTRTDEAGFYTLVQPRENLFWGIMAADQDMLPVYHNGFHNRPRNADDVVKLEAFELFPAARLIVTPEAFKDLAISYHWRFPAVEEGQAEAQWVQRLKGPWRHERYDFYRASWLKRNEAQPILVPAEVPMRVWFRTPYAKDWADGKLDEDLTLEKGQTLTIPQAVTFEKCILRSVRVIDEQGNPVEDVPVRTMHEGDRAWAVSRRTDASGTATLYVEPNRPGRFGITIRPRIEVPFDLREDDWEEPVEIVLTDEQVEQAQGLQH